MIALVTGSSGFIGSHVVERLVADGLDVRCLTRRGSAPPQWGADVQAAVTRAAVDLRSARELAATPLLDGVDLVIHCAGATRARRISDFHAANVAPVEALLHALRRRGERPRFVLLSSQAAAGPAASLDRPITERDVPRPVEAYGASKLLAERVLQTTADLPWTIVRPASVYGPRDRDFLALFRSAMRGVLVYPGTRRSWLSILHVHDCVDGILAAARSGSAEERTFNLANAAPVSWQDVYAAVAAAVGRQPRELSLPGWLLRAAAPLAEHLWWSRRPPLLTRQKARLAAPRYWVCSSELAGRLLGVVPRTTLPWGMRETYLWYSENGWLRQRRGSAGLLRPVA